jgi:hypothetical protein
MEGIGTNLLGMKDLIGTDHKTEISIETIQIESQEILIDRWIAICQTTDLNKTGVCKIVVITTVATWIGACKSVATMTVATLASNLSTNAREWAKIGHKAMSNPLLSQNLRWSRR